MLFLVSVSQSPNTVLTSTCDRSRAKGTDRNLPCGEKEQKGGAQLVRRGSDEDGCRLMYHVDYQCREGLDSARRSRCVSQTTFGSSTRPSLSCVRAREPCYSFIILCSTVSASLLESNLRLCLAHALHGSSPPSHDLLSLPSSKVALRRGKKRLSTRKWKQEPTMGVTYSEKLSLRPPRPHRSRYPHRCQF